MVCQLLGQWIAYSVSTQLLSQQPVDSLYRKLPLSSLLSDLWAQITASWRRVNIYYAVPKLTLYNCLQLKSTSCGQCEWTKQIETTYNFLNSRWYFLKLTLCNTCNTLQLGDQRYPFCVESKSELVVAFTGCKASGSRWKIANCERAVNYLFWASLPAHR